MKYTTLLYLVFFWTLFGYTVVGQPLNLTCEEKLEIKKRAQLKLEEFEGLLRFIADPTRSRGAVDQAIKSSYTDGKYFKQVFYDSTVRIENDILPHLDAASESDIAVDAYLNQFKLFYEKSREPNIFFENVWFSDIQENQFVYIVASYQSRFTGTHRELKSMTYQPQSRSVTLRAEFNSQLDHWEVWIVGVTYRRENELPSFPPDPCNPVAVTDTVNTTITDLKEITDNTITSDTINKNTSDIESFHFTQINTIYKQGRKYNIAWNQSIDSLASLSLYQNGALIKTIDENVSGTTFLWKVPKSLEKGNNYYFQLHNPNTMAAVESGTFRIKKKTPWGMYLGLAVGLGAVGYILCEDGNCFGKPLPSETYLPKPPKINQ